MEFVFFTTFWYSLALTNLRLTQHFMFAKMAKCLPSWLSTWMKSYSLGVEIGAIDKVLQHFKYHFEVHVGEDISKFLGFTIGDDGHSLKL